MPRPKPATADEIRKFLADHPEWCVRDNKLHRKYIFPDFRTAFAFMTKVAELAEGMDHHPEWSNVYNRLVIDLVTHDAGAITALDIRMAGQIETLFYTFFIPEERQ